MHYLRSAATVFLLCALAGCGGGSTPATSQTGAKPAYLRVVNASPDIETVNTQLPAGAPPCNFQTTQPSFGSSVSVQIDGTTQVASFPYGFVSQYVPVSAGSASVAVVYPVSVQSVCPSYIAKITVSAGSRYTVVVAGSYQQKTLQWLTFNDSFTSGAQMYNVSTIASPSVVGTFTPGNTDYQPQASLALGQSSQVPVASSAPGTAFFAGPAANPVAVLQPSNVDSFDSNNVVPFDSYRTFSVFVIDPPLGGTFPQLVGGFQ
jgi:hypothetical protein